MNVQPLATSTNVALLVLLLHCII